MMKKLGLRALMFLGLVISGGVTLGAFHSTVLATPIPQQALMNDPAVAPLRLEISLSRKQITLFQGTTQIKSYPVAVGRPGWETPTGVFQVQSMIRDPAWKNPFNDSVIPGGHARNPLGRRWIGFWSDGKNWIGLHGTPNPESVGHAISHGCVRMHNRDIEELFETITMGTPVVVVR